MSNASRAMIEFKKEAKEMLAYVIENDDTDANEVVSGINNKILNILKDILIPLGYILFTILMVIKRIFLQKTSTFALKNNIIEYTKNKKE